MFVTLGFLSSGGSCVFISNFSVGIGATSLVVIDERVFIMGWADGHDTLRCLAADRRREIWVAAERSQAGHDGARQGAPPRSAGRC
jgi:hypothetical protein